MKKFNEQLLKEIIKCQKENNKRLLEKVEKELDKIWQKEAIAGTAILKTYKMIKEMKINGQK